jgi:uncharacterized protein
MASELPLKIVLDTNWYLSATINRGSRRAFYQLLVNQNLKIHYSEELFVEFQKVIY